MLGIVDRVGEEVEAKKDDDFLLWPCDSSPYSTMSHDHLYTTDYIVSLLGLGYYDYHPVFFF